MNEISCPCCGQYIDVTEVYYEGYEKGRADKKDELSPYVDWEQFYRDYKGAEITGEIIVCEATSNHTCGECARDKSYCNYPNDNVVACEEFVEFEEDKQI